MKKKNFLLAVSLLLCVCAAFGSMGSVFAQEQIFYKDAVVSGQTRAANDINYTSKSEQVYTSPISFPIYYNTNVSLANACAPVAGANIVGYYDRFNENLIPNQKVYMAFGPRVLYHTMVSSTGPVLQSLIGTMHSMMATNQIQAGTTETQFMTGLTSYVSGKGYTLSKTSIAGGGVINVQMLDEQLRAGKPVLLLCNKYNKLSTFTDNGSTVSIAKTDKTVAHMMVAYGYKYVTYNLVGGGTKTNLYLQVSFGDDSNNASGYTLATDASFVLNNAYAMNIS